MTNHPRKFLPHLVEKTLSETYYESPICGPKGHSSRRLLIASKQTWPHVQGCNCITWMLTCSFLLSCLHTGAVVLQQQVDVGWKPVAYASRALSSTEQWNWVSREKDSYQDWSQTFSPTPGFKESGWTPTTYTTSTHDAHEVLLHYLSCGRKRQCNCRCSVQSSC